jgi:glycine reductase
MLLDKIAGNEFETELPMPIFEKFEPSPAIKDMSKARIVVMTTGGMVPQGNPHRLEACNCTKWEEYSLDDDYCGRGVTKGMVVHGGYDPIYGNEDGNGILPADALLEFEKEGRIGEFYGNAFVTVGNGMGTDQAAEFGDAIAQKLKEAQIDGAILTST